MTKAEAWQQCSARGTTVTRLAYIMGFNPSCERDGQREKGIKRERNLGIPGDTSDQARSSFFLLCSSIFYLKFSPL